MWNKGIHIWQVPFTKIEPNVNEYYKVCTRPGSKPVSWLTQIIGQVMIAVNLLNTPILPLAKASIICLLFRVRSVLSSVRRPLYVIQAFNVLTCIIP
jgi:hypothetical protein